MKTEKFAFAGYFETAGGPVCICSAEALSSWSGAEKNGLYWRAVEELGTDLLEKFQDKFYFFNSETGNFLLFRSEEKLVIAEIISVESSFCIPWQEGIEFAIENWQISVSNLSGLICVFDSALTLHNDYQEECFRAVNGVKIWNAAFIKGVFSSAKEVSLNIENIQMSGILLDND